MLTQRKLIVPAEDYTTRSWRGFLGALIFFILNSRETNTLFFFNRRRNRLAWNKTGGATYLKRVGDKSVSFRPPFAPPPIFFPAFFPPSTARFQGRSAGRPPGIDLNRIWCYLFMLDLGRLWSIWITGQLLVDRNPRVNLVRRSDGCLRFGDLNYVSMKD